MRWFRSKRGFVVVGVLVLLALFLFRPAANQLRSRIVSSISMALGRSVEVAYVRIRLLPRPGFDLENFVVADNPAFGAEPMLRADSVTASLRVRSLLRGRLEIVRLSLTEPSLNLVRNSDGHWNIESLLERSSQIQAAPTGKLQTEKRRMFPYIEASRGRINVKFGAEKKPYAFTDADFSLWQDSENSWGTRLRAQPVRTDLNLTDTGLIQVNGTWQRAPMLRNTPLRFTLTWERGQLGQLSKLVNGNDMGWRGALKTVATLSGTPADLAVVSEFSADDFHRYDVVENGGLRLAAECSGHYSTVDKLLSQISCHAPGPDGAITFAGSVGNLLESRDYDITVAIHGLPAQALTNLAHHVTYMLPDDLTATGQIDAHIEVERGRNRQPEWSGEGEISDLRLASGRINGDLELHGIPFSIATARQSRNKLSGDTFPGKNLVSVPRVEIGPLRVALGRPVPAVIQGWIARSGYAFEISGEGQIQRWLLAGRMIGLPTFSTQAEGLAKVDLQIAGNWSGGVPKAMGSAQLRSARAQLRHWNGPLEIASAELNLRPEEIDIRNINSTVAGSTWRGSLQLPRPCGLTAECAITFDLHADQISLAALNQLLNPASRAEPWYRFLSSSESSVPPFLMEANAAGKLAANRILLRNLVATQFSARAELKNGSLELRDMHADLLGGRHNGEWRANFTTKPPQYTGKGTIEHASLIQFAAAMRDGWVTGSADASYQIKTTGLTQAELSASTTGTVQVRAWDGSLPHLVLSDGAPAVQFHRLTAGLRLDNEKFAITGSELNTTDGHYELSGTASFGHVLDLKLTRDGEPAIAITGTLEEPRVSETGSSETQAALKASDR